MDEMKICRKTNEIYVLCENKFSVYSLTGACVRKFESHLSEAKTFSLTGDGHVLVCGKSEISVLTCDGDFVCWWHLGYAPFSITSLSYDRIAIGDKDGVVRFYSF